MESVSAGPLGRRGRHGRSKLAHVSPLVFGTVNANAVGASLMPAIERFRSRHRLPARRSASRAAP